MNHTLLPVVLRICLLSAPRLSHASLVWIEYYQHMRVLCSKSARLCNCVENRRRVCAFASLTHRHTHTDTHSCYGRNIYMICARARGLLRKTMNFHQSRTHTDFRFACARARLSSVPHNWFTNTHTHTAFLWTYCVVIATAAAAAAAVAALMGSSRSLPLYDRTARTSQAITYAVRASFHMTLSDDISALVVSFAEQGVCACVCVCVCAVAVVAVVVVVVVIMMMMMMMVYLLGGFARAAFGLCFALRAQVSCVRSRCGRHCRRNDDDHDHCAQSLWSSLCVLVYVCVCMCVYLYSSYYAEK